MWRLLVRSPVVRGVARGLAMALIAGIGYKLGGDLYDGAKRRMRRERNAPAPAPE